MSVFSRIKRRPAVIGAATLTALGLGATSAIAAPPRPAPPPSAAMCQGGGPTLNPTSSVPGATFILCDLTQLGYKFVPPRVAIKGGVTVIRGTITWSGSTPMQGLAVDLRSFNSDIKRIAKGCKLFKPRKGAEGVRRIVSLQPGQTIGFACKVRVPKWLPDSHFSVAVNFGDQERAGFPLVPVSASVAVPVSGSARSR